MKGHREIVCLIGSSRFQRAHLAALRRETLAGKIVLVMGMFGHNESGFDMDGPVKKMLDELHLDKIDESSSVLVVNERRPRCPECGRWFEWEYSGGTFFWNRTCECRSAAVPVPYIGASTKNELAYARKQGKKVRWWHLPCAEALEGEWL
jgi:hypothetical protein